MFLTPKTTLARLSGLWKLIVFMLAAATMSWAEGYEIKETAIPNGVSLVVSSPWDTEFTTTIDCTLDNATCSQPLPFTVDSAGQQSFQIVEIKAKDSSKAWKYSFKFNCKPGARRKDTTNSFSYALPFSPQQHLPVQQGVLGRFSHFKGSQDEFAVDWKAPEGTTVCAARAGVVTGLRQGFREGGVKPDLKLKANYIVIKHEDGTFAEYVHLQPGSALVSIGDKVTEGQSIARSGNTGFTSIPHIHFAVFQTVDGYTRMTLPCHFKTRGGVIENPKTGATY